MRRDGVPTETPPVMSRIEVADLVRPTTQMPPLFDEQLVIEEHVPTVSGEHPALASRDSLQVAIVDLRASGLVPIEEGAAANESTAPLKLSQDELDSMSAIAKVNSAALESVIVDMPPPIELIDSEVTAKNRTSLGVAPFVVDTPVPRWNPVVKKSEVSTELPRERTAMVALDPSSGAARGGPWQAVVSVARSLRSVRWWRRRKTSQVKRVDP